MKTVILKGCEKELKDELRGIFKSSLPLRRRLTDLMNEKIESHFKAQYNRDGYESANWAYAQADSMGYCRALREVVSLLDESKADETWKKPQGRPTNESKSPSPLV